MSDSQDTSLQVIKNQETLSQEVEALLEEGRSLLAKIRECEEAARASSAGSAEQQKAIVAAAADAQAKIADINSVATLAVTAKTQITDDQAVIATKSEHIESAQVHADKVRAELDRVFTAANQKATETEGHQSRAKTAADSSNELLSQIRMAREAVGSEAKTIQDASESAKASAKTLEGLASKATTVETRIADYEARLAKLEGQCKEQLETIVGLLPGATSAGLAHAFDDRRQAFMNPSRRWQWVFVGSVLVLAVLASTVFWQVFRSTTALTYDDIGRLWLSRLPLAGAFIWLALHASREASLSKRLEEDYGYKAAIASSFQGFHKQMTDIGKEVNAGTPLAKLCDDTLMTIGNPPGRIYDKHNLVVTPMDKLNDTLKSMMDSIKPGNQSAK